MFWLVAARIAYAVLSITNKVLVYEKKIDRREYTRILLLNIQCNKFSGATTADIREKNIYFNFHVLWVKECENNIRNKWQEIINNTFI